MKYQILLQMKSTPKWMGLSKAYREKVFTDVVYPLFLDYTDDLQIQLFSTGAFHASVSDVIDITTEKLEEYYRFLQELKSSRIFSEEYFQLHDVIVGMENGFSKFNEDAKKGKNFVMN